MNFKIKANNVCDMCGIFAYITNTPNINKPTNIYNENFIERQFAKGKSRGPESSQTLIKNYLDNYLFLDSTVLQ